ncbi:MAG TPA: glycosyltransferase [Chthonomonadaceae bacterium]|nr:glycosyltransferase [Chthonomonadaceae bacterium]
MTISVFKPGRLHGARAASVPPVERKRVLYVDHTAEMGGGELALLHLLRHLDRTRYQPVVVLFSEGPLVEEMRAAGVEAHVLPLDPRIVRTRKDSLGLGSLARLRDAARTALYVGRLARFIRAQRIALVHTNSLKADVIGGLAARLARTPLLFHVRDRIAEDYLPGPAARAFRWLCRTLPDYVVANSDATLRSLCLPAKERAATVYSGIEIREQGNAGTGDPGGSPAGSTVTRDDGNWEGTRGKPAPEALAAGTGLSRTFGAPGPQPRVPSIGLIGRISPWKGQHIFLQAAAQVRERVPEARFLIVGSALFGEEDYERQVRVLTADLGLEECVEFTGFRKDVAALIQTMDILVHASTTGEPFGKVVVEGMAAGKPVVATNGGGIPEIVEDGVTGLLVPMGDAESMAEAICRLLAHPETARAMGRQGHERARARFTIQHTTRQMEGVYHKMLQRGHPVWAGVSTTV